MQLRGLASQVQNLTGRRELWAWADAAGHRQNFFPISKAPLCPQGLSNEGVRPTQCIEHCPLY